MFGKNYQLLYKWGTLSTNWDVRGHVVFTDSQLHEEPQGWQLALKPTFAKWKYSWIPAQLKVISILLLYYMQIFLAQE